MSPSRPKLQPVTPEARAWAADALAQGDSRNAIFHALRQAGWQPLAACQVLGLSPEEQQALNLPHTEPDWPPAAPVPQIEASPPPAEAGADTLINAGDKWVKARRLQAHALYSEAPQVWVFDNLLSAPECAALMEAASPRLARSLTVDTRTGGEELNPERTSDGMFFGRGETPLITRLEARIAALLGWPVQNGEGLQVLRYRPGAEYKPHYDYFDPWEPGTPAILRRGGQRVASLIMYLQEPEAGGGTIFPDLGLRVVPRQGSAVFFSYPQAHPVSCTLHGGEPVTAGEKWIATKWLREKEFT